MKTLITGATGFIGSNLVTMLTSKNRDVRCLVRRTSHTKLLEDLGVEIVYGDILDQNSLLDAVKDVSVIHHLAGEVYSHNDDDYFKMNVHGTKNLLEACINGNPSLEKFIFYSSIAAFGPLLEKNRFINEDSACNPITSYGKTKLEAQNLVLNYFRDYAIPTLVICLPLVYGPMDNSQSRILTLFQRMRDGTFRVIGRGDNLISICYVENLISFIFLIEQKEDCIGKLYFVSDGFPLTFNQICKVIAEEIGLNIPNFHIPIWLAIIAEKILNVSYKIHRSSTPRFQFNVRYLTSNWACDISRAEKEVGYKPLFNFKEGLKKTIQWYSNKLE